MAIVKKLIRIIKLLWLYEKYQLHVSSQFDNIYNEMALTKEAVADAIDIHADIHTQMSSFVIVVARYRKADFVKCYNVHDSSVDEIVNHLKHVSQRGRIGRVDAHPEIKYHIKNLM